MNSNRKRQSEAQDDSAKKQKTREAQGGVKDQVATALRKIRCYVGVPSKFNKAAKLLLSLLQQGHVTASYSMLFFEVLACSMLDRNACLVAEYRKSYCKLVAEAVKLASMFGQLQRKQLEVYQIWTICRNELNTDDSFVFGKNMSKLRELALQLPVCSEDDETALTNWSKKMASAREYYEEHRRTLESNSPEESCRGIMLWTDEECLAARREAIVDWLEAAKPFYQRQWACTAIDISVTTLNENKHRFCEDQKERIENLARFSKDRKMRRRQGPTSKEKRRDANSFDQARSEWSKAQVSNRGMVGDTGDHRAEAWLG